MSPAHGPQQLRVAPPEDATPAPIPAELADRLDALPIDDGETYWTVSRLVEYAFRRGYADGHARGYRDRDRETVVGARPSGSVDQTQQVRTLKATDG
jgi:hypothetical protein